MGRIGSGEGRKDPSTKRVADRRQCAIKKCGPKTLKGKFLKKVRGQGRKGGNPLGILEWLPPPPSLRAYQSHEREPKNERTNRSRVQ